MARKITRKRLIKKLDKLAREIVFERDNHTCVTCGSTRPTWSHVFSRRTHNTRWDMMNSHVQCWPCNFKHVRDQYPYFEWFKEQYGEQAFQELRQRYTEVKRWTMLDLEAKLKELQSIKSY